MSSASISIPNATFPLSGLPNPKENLRRAAAFVLFLVLFASGLYLTHGLLQDAGILPDGLAYNTKTGRANTDINLRPSPNTSNDPIGLVTQNSKLRIVKIENNWYQVDVLEQGRQRDEQLQTTRGWLYGRYVDIDGN